MCEETFSVKEKNNTVFCNFSVNSFADWKKNIIFASNFDIVMATFANIIISILVLRLS